MINNMLAGVGLFVLGYLLSYLTVAKKVGLKLKDESDKKILRKKRNLFETPLPQKYKNTFDKPHEMIDNSFNGLNLTTGLYEPKKTLKYPHKNSVRYKES